MEQRQATYGEILDALDASMERALSERTRDAWLTRDGEKRPAPGGIGTLVRHTYLCTSDIETEVHVCVLGQSEDAPAFIVRMPGHQPAAQEWRAVQVSLDAVRATAELLPHTLTPEQVEALLCAAIHAQSACHEMARRAEDITNVQYAYRTGQPVRF